MDNIKKIQTYQMDVKKLKTNLLPLNKFKDAAESNVNTLQQNIVNVFTNFNRKLKSLSSIKIDTDILKMKNMWIKQAIDMIASRKIETHDKMDMGNGFSIEIFAGEEAKDSDNSIYVPTTISIYRSSDNYKYSKVINIYKVASDMTVKKIKATVGLNNDNYKMETLYPSTYKTMTEIPDLLDTSELTTMFNMFENCESLTTIPSDLNTSNVTTMSHMFMNCYNLKTFPNLNTSNVTNMNYMFNTINQNNGRRNTVLTSLPTFNTSKVTNMASMLAGLTKLSSVPAFDTTNVTDMSYMLQDCSTLTTTPTFKTTNVTNINYMLEGCTSLTTVPTYDTSNVVKMDGMFKNCSKITTIPLLNTDVSKLLQSKNNSINKIVEQY